MVDPDSVGRAAALTVLLADDDAVAADAEVPARGRRGLSTAACELAHPPTNTQPLRTRPRSTQRILTAALHSIRSSQ
jgi:hypothetical protein